MNFSETYTPLQPAQAAAKAPAQPRRMLAICNNLGLLPELFFPQGTGAGYPLSPYLKLLAALRRRLQGFFARAGAPPLEQWQTTTSQLLPIYK